MKFIVLSFIALSSFSALAKNLKCVTITSLSSSQEVIRQTATSKSVLIFLNSQVKVEADYNQRSISLRAVELSTGKSLGSLDVSAKSEFVNFYPSNSKNDTIMVMCSKL